MKEDDIEKTELLEEFFVVTNYANNEVVELKTNGKDIKVNNSNKEEYIDSLINYVTFQSIQGKIEPFLDGFFEVFFNFLYFYWFFQFFNIFLIFFFNFPIFFLIFQFFKKKLIEKGDSGGIDIDFYYWRVRNYDERIAIHRCERLAREHWIRRILQQGSWENPLVLESRVWIQSIPTQQAFAILHRVIKDFNRRI